MVLKLVSGEVKWFNSRKGYGFIQTEEHGDVFVHYTAIVKDEDEYKTLHEHDKVDFEITEGKKGPQAVNVVVTEAAPPSMYGSRNYRF